MKKIGFKIIGKPKYAGSSTPKKAGMRANLIIDRFDLDLHTIKPATNNASDPVPTLICVPTNACGNACPA